MTMINLEPFQLIRPEKISWLFPTDSDIFSQIKSKSLARFLKKTDQIIAKNQLIVSHVKYDQQTFMAWLPYYQDKMAENEYEQIATREWFDQKIEGGLSVEGINITQNNRLVGSAVYTKRQNEFCSLAFKASDRLNISPQSNASVGALLDYIFLKTMMAQGMKKISAGRSRNAFGVINTLGNLTYKLRLGYLPQPAKETNLLKSVPVNDQGYVVFFAEKAGKLTLFILKPKNYSLDIEAIRYLPANIKSYVVEY